MRRLHRLLAFLCLTFIALIIGANRLVHSDDLSYFMRIDVASMLALAFILALVLFWASSGDTDRQRVIGCVAAAGMTGLFLGTVSLPILATPVAIVGWFRLPTSRSARLALIALVPIGIAIGAATPYVARSLVTIS